MDIFFNSSIWQCESGVCIPDVKTTFAPVDNIRLWLRDENSAGVHGHVAVHEYYCLYLCLEGSGCIEIDGVPYFLEKNDALGVLPRQPHVRLRGRETGRFLLIRFLSSGEDFLRRLFAGVLRFDETLYPQIRQLVCAYEKAVAGADEKNQNETGLELSYLLNNLSACQKNPLLETASDKRIQEALKLILAPENLNLGIREIARKLGITPGHLSDLVHDNLGYPPRDIKRSVRYQVALNYLLYSSLSVSEIAEAAGFKSVYAFSRFFKNINGMSPLAYRRSHQKKSPDD